MLSVSLQDSSFPSDQPQFVSVSRIEVFVIPALAVDSAGYRVCLRLSSDLGYGWSEHFVSECEPSLQLDRWSPLLRGFIGRFPFAALTSQLTGHLSQSMNPENRAYRLVTDAVQQLQNAAALIRAAVSADASHSEESVLQQRAVAYLSVD
ncbi:hypothetical protein [Paenibacillus sp. PL2-23]|uniref:hypothetical protein n=1 Tax=Paenibacillus sp. PL2-23 TaxID=2100729 RepID=UPI0030F84F10